MSSSSYRCLPTVGAGHCLKGDRGIVEAGVAILPSLRPGTGQGKGCLGDVGKYCGDQTLEAICTSSIQLADSVSQRCEVIACIDQLDFPGQQPKDSPEISPAFQVF